MLTKQKTSFARGTQEGKGNQENCSAPGFMVMGVISRLSLANHSDSEYFLVVQVVLHHVQPRWMPERRILEGCRTHGVSF